MANQIVTTKPALIFCGFILANPSYPWMPAPSVCGRRFLRLLWSVDERLWQLCADRKDNVSAMHGQPSLGVDSMRIYSVAADLPKDLFRVRVERRCSTRKTLRAHLKSQFHMKILRSNARFYIGMLVAVAMLTSCITASPEQPKVLKDALQKTFLCGRGH